MALRVAAAQISSGPDPQANLTTIGDAVREAADRGARLVVLPEASMARFGSDLRGVAQPLDGEWAASVRRLAGDAGVVVVVGMFEPAGDGRVHNTLLVTGPGVETSYRKIHLFDAFGARESELVAPGAERVVVDVAGVRVGLATCFDLRFADQFTALGRQGAQLVVVPASWGFGPGKEEQWDLLTRARAADAQAWLVACDQAWTPPVGSHPLGLGRSVLVDPVGQVRSRLGQEPGLLVADVDVADVEATRARIPIL
jgi:deaminated glutathione amidase